MRASVFVRSLCAGLIALSALSAPAAADGGLVCLTFVRGNRDVPFKAGVKGAVGNLHLYLRSASAAQVLVQVVDGQRKPVANCPPQLIALSPNRLVIVPLSHANGAALKVYTTYFSVDDRDLPPVRTLVQACSAAPSDSRRSSQLLSHVGDWVRQQEPGLAHKGETPTQTGGTQVMTAGSANAAPPSRPLSRSNEVPAKKGVADEVGGGSAPPQPLLNWEKYAHPVRYGPAWKGVAVFHLKPE